MKCLIPEISWHNKDPVLSCDFQPAGSGGQQGGPLRLATGGSDTHVVIWEMGGVKGQKEGEEGDGGANVDLEVLCDMNRHQRAVNVVRWSPDGSLLASGDDENVIIIWQMKSGPMEGGGLFDDGEGSFKENWAVYKMIRFHLDDVFDLAWSPCGEFLVSGSLDNSVIISNVHNNKKVAHLGEGKGYMQGVAWNPKHQIISTLGSDRVCRSYSSGPSKKLMYKTYKAVINLKGEESGIRKKRKHPSGQPEPSSDNANPDTGMDVDEEAGKGETAATENKTEEEKTVRLFHDDTFKGFFRRLSWSPDGEILVVPSGVVEREEDTKVTHCTWVFTRVELSKPCLCLPSKDKYTICSRFSPLKYSYRLPKKAPIDPSQPPWISANALFALPYRLVYAVATQNAVMFYDTQQPAPFARVSNIHYAGLTDLTWSPCGRLLVVSSSDGYCSIVTFDHEEIGEVMKESLEDMENLRLNSPKKSVVDEPGDEVNPEGPVNINSEIVKDGKQSKKDSQLPLPNIIEVNRKEGGENKSEDKKRDEKNKSKGTAGGRKSKGQAHMDALIEKYSSEEPELSLVLAEESLPPPTIEGPISAKPKADRKRVPLTTLVSGESNKPATPEKSVKRRVNLITLSSPKSSL